MIKKKQKQRAVAWTAPEKPNVEFDDPAAKPNSEELASGPLDRAVFGRHGMGGFCRLVIAIGLFIVLFGTLFYLVQR